MSNPTHERLLGYLLDACDADERNEIEQHLQQDESLRQHCEILKRAIVPLACDKLHVEPPKGLTQRCCEYVFSRVELMPSALSPASGGGGVLTKPRRWSWLDIGVATAVAAAVLILVAPALYQSRVQALKNVCQNNLKDIGTALANYSNLHGGFYPTPPQQGGKTYASMWGPLLKDHLTSEDKVACPTTSAQCDPKLRLPQKHELEAMNEQQLQALVARLNRGIGFTFGFEDNGVYKIPRNLHRSKFAISGDLPGAGKANSQNHGGDGQNVLFEDGHVAYLVIRRLDKADSDIYSNDKGEVGPGTNPDDAVIAPLHIHVRIFFNGK
jgi:hypothetical protein